MHSRNAWMLISLLLVGAGCQRQLVATPTLLYQQDPKQVFAACAQDDQMPVAQVLYATDRARDDAGNYGYSRSTNLAFGTAQVNLNPHPTWSELIQESTRPNREREFELKLAKLEERGRIKNRLDPSLEPDPTIVQASFHDSIHQQDQFREMLCHRLARTPQKDVYIFIHGYNNTFEDAVFRAAEVWHFMGRMGVPVAYTWPAGYGGIRGYAYDRESGEFTVSHLREFIKLIATCAEVERVHLVAHSRGTEITISALRELNLYYSGQGLSTQQELKLENLVLAAPDVDEEVFLQRCVAENLLMAARRTTIYVSDRDRAIEAVDLVFASRHRLGALAVEDVHPKMRQKLAKMPNVQLIECKLSGWTLTHSYVFTHPAALSDLILVLRDRRGPGAANGRPLRQPAEGVWELTDDYLKSKS
jgi:esterase/lipase superfamily enzyme